MQQSAGYKVYLACNMNVWICVSLTKELVMKNGKILVALGIITCTLPLMAMHRKRQQQAKEDSNLVYASAARMP
jgi:hypothetical protein